MVEKNKAIVGWVSFIGLFIVIFCTFGVASGTRSIYNPENIARLGVSTTEYMTPVGLFSLMTGIACLLDSFLERLITAKGILGLAVVGDALGFVLLGLSTDMTLIWVGMLLLGLCNGFAFVTVFTAITDSWFAKNKALMGSIIGFAANISTSIWSPLTRYIINGYGWQTSYFVFAAIMFIAGGIGWLMVKNKPTNIEGMIWYEPGITLDESNAKEDRVPIGTVLKESLKNNKVILVLLCTFFIGFIFNPISQSYTNIMQANGWAKTDVAAMFGVYYIFLATGKVVIGVITDNIGIRLSTMGIFLCNIIGFVIMLNTQAGNALGGYLSVIFLGFSAAATTYLTACMMMSCVERHDYYVGMISVTTFLVSVCNAISVVLMAFMFDTFGSYTPGIYMLITMSVICLIISWILSSGMQALNKRAKNRVAAAKEK